MKEKPYTNMDEGSYRAAYLITAYIRGTINEREHDELNDWVNASDFNMQLFEDLTNEDNVQANLEWLERHRTEEAYYNALNRGPNSPRKEFQRVMIWLAASVVVVMSVILVYNYTRDKTEGGNSQDSLVATDTSALQPGGNRATLTLADGSVIDLTTMKNGSINYGKGSHVKKPAEGELVYEENGVPVVAPSIHTLSTPVGGQYMVVLPDRTKVWLNAATTLKYPSQFGAGERIVEVDGEAYFEVAKNKDQLFRVVLSDSSTVTVLGTHFNVMSYANEPAREITLLEGSISVSKNNNSKKLEPGTQARVTADEITRKAGIDTEEIVGWKNGLFEFKDAPIELIMHQVERWYDAKVVYRGEVKQLFNATISRKEPLSKLLRLLELNGYVHFTTENNIIYVYP